MFTHENELEALRLKAYFPFRIVFIAVKEGNETIVSVSKTMRKINDLSRDNYTVYQVK